MGTKVRARRDMTPRHDERTIGVEIVKWLPHNQACEDDDKIEFMVVRGRQRSERDARVAQ